MYASFFETKAKNYAIIAPSRNHAALMEAAIRAGNRVKSYAYCEFIFDDDDAMKFVEDYAGDEYVEVNRVGF